MGIYKMPLCPECKAQIKVGDLITDSLANCSNCGHTVSLPWEGGNRSTKHSPAPQTETKQY